MTDNRGWTIETRVAVLETEVRELKQDIGALRRAFYTLAVSIVSAAVIFAFTVLTLLHK